MSDITQSQDIMNATRGASSSHQQEDQEYAVSIYTFSDTSTGQAVIESVEVYTYLHQ